jgi:hypothetical protein
MNSINSMSKNTNQNYLNPNYSSQNQANHLQQLRPFLSVLFIIMTLFGLVFIKMEERRLSYVVLKLSKELKKSIEIKKQKELVLAKLTRPQLLENVATQKLTLKRVKPEQIIQLTPTQSLTQNNLGFNL